MKISNIITNSITLILAISAQEAHGKPDNYDQEALELETNRHALRGGSKLITETFEEQVAEALNNYEAESCKKSGSTCTASDECCSNVCGIFDNDDDDDAAPEIECTGSTGGTSLDTH